jgi:GAF domain-containing protein/HAMP domain-containing protein
MNERRRTILTGSIRYRLLFIMLVIGAVVPLVITLIAVQTTREQGRLASQMSIDALQEQAETYLMQITQRNANENDLFLEHLRLSTQQLANYAASVYDNPQIFSTPEDWRLLDHMSRGAEGQYLNGEADITSVFLPSTQPINEMVIRDVALGAYLEFPMQSLYQSNENITAIYFATPDEVIRYYPNVRLGLLVAADFRATQRVWYTRALPENNPQGLAVWSPVYVDATGLGLVTTASSPAYNSSGELIGVVGFDVTLTDMAENVESTRVLETGYTFLMDQDGQSVALPEQGYRDILGQTAPEEQASTVLSTISTPFAAVISEMMAGQNGFQKVELEGEILYVAYAPLKNTGWSLGTVAREADVLAGVTVLQTQLEGTTRELVTNRIIPFSVIIFIMVVLLGLIVSRRLVNPIQKLANAAQEVSAGQWNVEIPQEGTDEIGLLGRAFASMTKQLQTQFQNLESRVESRTHDLSRKTAQLEAASEVAREAAAIRDLDQLLEQVTQLISAKFGFYHAGIFLLDEAREYAVLRAASSEGGRNMVARGHRLKVGEVGIVGYVAGRTRPRIAFDVGEDAVYFHNPDLPLTRSEMAIPLKSQERVIGVLDVQSVEPSAFTPDDIEILQVLADQVALAVDNARLITETRQAIEELNRSYSQQNLFAWSERLRGRSTGFFYNSLGVTPIEKAQMDRDRRPPTLGISSGGDGSLLVVPIVVHGQVLGGIHLNREKGEAPWTEEELRVVEQAIAQIGPALENARLLEEAQTRASREQTVNVIATQVRNAAGVQAILQNTVRELGKALGVSHTFIQFGTEPVDDAPATSAQPILKIGDEPQTDPADDL